jgi:hypothetical protein
MEPEGSLPRSQEPSTAPYPEPDRSNPFHSGPILHETLPSVYVSVCVSPVLLLGDGSVKCYRRNEYTQQRKNCWKRRFLYSSCRIKWK